MAKKPQEYPIGEIVNEAKTLAIKDRDRLSKGIAVTGEGEARKKNFNTELMRKAVGEVVKSKGLGSAQVDLGEGDAGLAPKSTLSKVVDATAVAITGPLGAAVGVLGTSDTRKSGTVPLKTYITTGLSGAGGGVGAFKNAVAALPGETAAANNTEEQTTSEGGADETSTYVEGEDNARAERRFQEQCFLIDHYEPIVRDNQRKPYGKYFTCVELPPSRVISRISTTEDISSFVDIKPHELAGLHPQLRFFKVHPGGSKGRAGRIEKEILFVDHNSKQSIDEYFSNRKGRVDGVGIKKFTWKYIGKTDVEVERNIKCKLTLSFRNLEDIDPADINKKKYATFLDMILFSTSKNSRTVVKDPFGVPFDEWDPEKYEIKVVAGWSAPTSKNNLVSKKLRRFLETQSTTMHLGLLGHAFDFKDDGSGTLQIEFLGRIDMSTNSANVDIFNMGKNFKKGLEKKKKSLEKAQKKAKTARNAADAQGFFSAETLAGIPNAMVRAADSASNAITGGSGYSDPTTIGYIRSTEQKAQESEEQVRVLQQNLDTFVTSEKSRRYQLLLQRLYESGNMRFIDLPEAQVNLMQEGQLERKQAAIMRKYGVTGKSKKNSTPKRKRVEFTIQRVNAQQYAGDPRSAADFDANNTAAARAMKKASDEPSTKEAETDQQREDKLKANLDDAQRELQNSSSKPANFYRINYFYLGDLLEAAFSLLGNIGSDSKTIRYLLGDLTMIDPLTGGVVAFNMADVPVSLILFLEWYNNKAIKTQRESWPIKQFIQDVVRDLVIASLSPECFAGYNSIPNVHVSHVEGPADGKGRDRVNSGKGGRVRKIGQIKPHPPRRTAALTKAGKLYNYNFIYTHNAPSPGLVGSSARDTKRGIYHFYQGADKGILKSIKYSRRDMPYLKAARTEMDGVDPVSAQIRENYTVNLTTIGSTFFRPGQYVFIHPRVSGGRNQRARSLTMKLGMAGYVHLTEVECIVEPGRFETRLEGFNDGMIGMKIGTKIPKAKRIKPQARARLMSPKEIEELRKKAPALAEAIEQTNDDKLEAPSPPVATARNPSALKGGGQYDPFSGGTLDDPK